MVVTEYKPKNELGCRYSYDKLDNVVYLISKTHTKNVYIDNGEAYIDGLTEVPMRLDGFNIEFNEDSSLDERYKFSKTVKISVHGYVSHTALNSKYYVIIKSKDGTRWLVNVDFPSKVTYDFSLNGSQYQTTFTFSSLSNFPTLRVANSISEGSSVCKELSVHGIDKLKLLETDYCKLNTVSGTVYTYGKAFVDVDFLGQACSLEESFDGEKLKTTISFNISFDSYKSSWHYNLLEFLQNKYSAIITPKGNNNTFFSGFNFGLEPSFKIESTSNNGQSDIITITLTETSLQGTIEKSTWSEHEETDTTWSYIKNVGIIVGYECVGVGTAKYLLQQELNQNGFPTGRYKALQGYEGNFPTLNIVGTFTEISTFSNPDCSETACQVNTNIPSSLTYRSATCNTYSYSASCDWHVSGLASYMSVSPTSGSANSSYTLSVCNSKTPTTNESSMFSIVAGNNTRIINVNLTTDSDILNPSGANISCLAQTVEFRFNSTCPITVTNISQNLTYQISSSILYVNVPRNSSTIDYMNWNLTVKDCNNNTQTVMIMQDKTYERWATVDGYICSGTTSYTRLQRYTGTTSSNINTPTSEYKSGSKIKDNDSRCGSYSIRWVTKVGEYTCVDGNKWTLEEEQISYDGSNWTPTGSIRLGEMVEESSSFCEQTIQYKWVLTDRWQCSNIETSYRWQASGTTCIGYDKWQNSIRQVSYDGGTTWYNVIPLEYSATSLIEVDSEDCGYVPPTPYSAQYLTFVAEEDGTFSFSGNSIDYSLDGGTTWVTLASNTNSPTVQSGNTIMWKATLTPSSNGIGRFSSSGNFTVEGNSMSLLYGDDFEDKTSLSGNWVFRYLFRDCTRITSARNMSLPATITSFRCYAYMFYGCTSLTAAPQLPATTLARYCYENMFGGCTSLTAAPQLPATTLTSNCYVNMFNGCTSLTTAPQLPATTLAEYCYGGMFNGCTSLTTAPSTLPATTLAEHCYTLMFEGCTSLTEAPSLPSSTLASYCYNRMFNGCTSLTTAPSLLATTLAEGCYYQMFMGCTSLTTAPQLLATTLAEHCYSLMFYGCTSLTAAPQLPATTLARSCYSAMFEGCTSLTTAPSLLATTLAEGCYSNMFYDCTSLNTVTCLATDISAEGCTGWWLYGVASSGTFTKASSMNSWTTGVNGIPNNWTVQNV